MGLLVAGVEEEKLNLEDFLITETFSYLYLSIMLYTALSR